MASGEVDGVRITNCRIGLVEPDSKVGAITPLELTKIKFGAKTWIATKGCK